MAKEKNVKEKINVGTGFKPVPMDELNRIRQYIINNPIKWELDRNNPKYI